MRHLLLRMPLRQSHSLQIKGYSTLKMLAIEIGKSAPSHRSVLGVTLTPKLRRWDCKQLAKVKLSGQAILDFRYQVLRESLADNGNVRHYFPVSDF